MSNGSQVYDNVVESRYELTIGDAIALAAYRCEDDRVVFTHTVVPPAFEGQGIGSRLIGAALADVRARELRVVAQCAFVAAYIERHPEERDLLAGQLR